jgi:hypothetical protein
LIDAVIIDKNALDNLYVYTQKLILRTKHLENTRKEEKIPA